MVVRYQSVEVDGINVFYREAGGKNRPSILLLHGFPTSSHMFRELIPRLEDRYHVIAPDMPGFGFTEVPSRTKFKYTFDNLAKIIARFTEKVGFKKFAMYIFDYGAPVGLRIALAHPEKISAIISQNGNAYEEGLSEGWKPIQTYWKEPTEKNRQALNQFLTPISIKGQYLHGVKDRTMLAPDGYVFDSALFERPENNQIQLDLFLDYANNVKLYPKFQEYFRKNQPPLLAVWGSNDPFFLPLGAESFKRDIPNAEVHLLDTGHFALETHIQEIASLMHKFLERV